MILTAFQSSLLARLTAALARHDLPCKIREVETSVVDSHVVVRAADVDAYIYLDEAGWKRGGQWQAFERPDFETEEQLIAAFVAEVVDVVATGRTPEQSSGSTVVTLYRSPVDE